MKRKEYRDLKQQKQAMPRDKKALSRQLKKQETTEFSRETFQQLNASHQENINHLDTNEIFFRREKEKQWAWFNPQEPWRLIIAFGLVLLALVVLKALGPAVFHFFAQLFY